MQNSKLTPDTSNGKPTTGPLNFKLTTDHAKPINGHHIGRLSIVGLRLFIAGSGAGYSSRLWNLRELAISMSTAKMLRNKSSLQRTVRPTPLRKMPRITNRK